MSIGYCTDCGSNFGHKSYCPRLPEMTEDNTVPLPDHPEPWSFKWSKLEERAIKEYGDARVKAERERLVKEAGVSRESCTPNHFSSAACLYGTLTCDSDHTEAIASMQAKIERLKAELKEKQTDSLLQKISDFGQEQGL